jgi:hypothetical protein
MPHLLIMTRSVPLYIGGFNGYTVCKLVVHEMALSSVF